MGVTEVCQALGIVHSNLDKVRDLPPPIETLIGGRIWRADDIIPFARKYRERTGRPPLEDV